MSPKYNFNRVTHYIPPSVNFAELEKEFIEPTPEDYFIYWLFGYRCLECKRPASEINEILPRGRSKKNILDYRNRVTLCSECHRNFHHNGVTPDKISAMQETRKQFLVSTNREVYI